MTNARENPGDANWRRNDGTRDGPPAPKKIGTESAGDADTGSGGGSSNSTGMSGVAPGTRDTSGASSVPTSRLLAAIEPVSRRAQTFVGFFATLGLLSGLSALVVVLLVYLPFDPFAWWKVVTAVATLLVLALPAAVLFVFRLGLHQLVTLPERLVDASTELSSTSREAYAAVTDGSGKRFGRLLGLVQSIARLRSLLFDSREAVMGASVLVRVANPIVLVLVLASVVVSGLLIAVAAVAGAIAVF
ncbi:MAG: hypothetical protein KJO98_02425 [Rhodothermia bacterium]|nr:hypothetical protein [Rhodothermia bacterium]